LRSAKKFSRFAAGTVDVVCNCAVLTEGWDRPEVSCLILARPTKSLGLYRQMVGRILRPAASKADALILDHSGAVFVHGFPDDDIAWTLDTDKKAVNEAHATRQAEPHSRRLTTCPECYALRVEGQRCGSCGWRPVRKPEPVEIADGKLGEVSRDRSVHVSPEDELALYRELLGILAEKRCRNPTIKDGWAAVKFKEKTGRWPPFPWRSAGPLPPSPATRAWVRSRDIAYAKGDAGAAMNTIERAQGRWREILPQLGAETRFLTNKHGPCPMCGGKDRFRFDDRDGSGSYYCNQCGPGPGLLLVRKLCDWDHKTACREIDKVIGINTKSPLPSTIRARRDAAQKEAAHRRLLDEARQPDVVQTYLRRRGLTVTSPVLRGNARCAYYDERTSRLVGHFPAVIAPILVPRWQLAECATDLRR
jgi:hypothetical protein